jgi:outer membrane protein OmpA-like peptidoglycan-associated protein
MTMISKSIRSSGILASAVAAVLLAGCAGAPPRDAELEQAQAAYQKASNDPKLAQAAPEQLRKASAALDRSTTLQKQGAPQADVDHYAYITVQQVAIAQQLADADESQAYVKQGSNQRNKVLLVASQQQTQQAQLAAQNANIQTQQAQQAAQDANAQNQQAQLQAATATAAADQANQQNAQLQQQIAALDAKQTDRGLVLTLGSVLFDTNQADLKPGSDQSLDKLAQFMRDNPKRNVMIEGYTDSSGNVDSNLGLSTRRAASVQTMLIHGGIDPQRTATRGFGVGYPVATNGTAAGRQQNRRVEIVISDANGNFPLTR